MLTATMSFLWNDPPPVQKRKDSDKNDSITGGQKIDPSNGHPDSKESKSIDRMSEPEISESPKAESVSKTSEDVDQSDSQTNSEKVEIKTKVLEQKSDKNIVAEKKSDDSKVVDTRETSKRDQSSTNCNEKSTKEKTSEKSEKVACSGNSEKVLISDKSGKTQPSEKVDKELSQTTKKVDKELSQVSEKVEKEQYRTSKKVEKEQSRTSEKVDKEQSQSSKNVDSKSVETQSEEKSENKSNQSKTESSENSVLTTKRKLFEGSNQDLDEEEEASTAAVLLKKVKRTHGSHLTKVPNLRSANAITSSLSSSMLERLEKSRSVGKRKLRSPEHGTNESKCPKKETLKPSLQMSGCDIEATKSTVVSKEAIEKDDTEADESFQESISTIPGVEPITDDSNSPDVVDSGLLINNETTFENRLLVKEEEDRRHEISDVAALEEDQRRDLARANQLLEAFDDSDEEN